MTALEIFVDNELDENLEAIAGGENLEEIAFNLLKWARRHEGGLDELYEAFKAVHPSHPVIEDLERENIIQVQQGNCLSQADWQLLFDQFVVYDLADLCRAFFSAFQAVMYIDFYTAQRDVPPPLTNIAQIRELLKDYDRGKKGPELAVRFVTFAIEELQRSDKNQNRDLTGMRDWQNRIARKFDVKELPAIEQTVAYAYLLITLEQYGADVIVYPELRITGIENKITFGAQPVTCAVKDVSSHIERWIKQAELASEIRQCKEEAVILEIFLQRKHVVDDVAATWTVTIDGNTKLLGTYRRYLVRSAERIANRTLQKALTARWQLLKTCVAARNACEQFHTQMTCPVQSGTLTALLEDESVPGIKLVAQLPSENMKRQSLLGDIINAPVPIALWSLAMTEEGGLEAEFDDFLNTCQLTNFADLARQWRRHRMDYETKPEKHIKLLCDCPDRWPQLPDIKHQNNDHEDEDSIAIVA